MVSLSPHQSDRSSQPNFAPPSCLRPTGAGSASEVPHFRGHYCVRFRYDPVTHCHPKMPLSMGIRDSDSLLPAIQATRFLAFTLAGLTAAARVSSHTSQGRLYCPEGPSDDEVEMHDLEGYATASPECLFTEPRFHSVDTWPGCTSTPLFVYIGEKYAIPDGLSIICKNSPDKTWYGVIRYPDWIGVT